VEAEAKTGFITWDAASFFPMKKTTPLALWLLDQSDENPQQMNCWESVFYAAIMSKVIDKNYLIWANTTHDITKAWKPDGFDQLPNFLLEMVKIRDHYWSFPSDPLEYKDDRLPQAGKGEVERFACLPTEVTIPKGRIVILNFGSHVAISTGKLRALDTELAVRTFNSLTGHGILELDHNNQSDDDKSGVTTIRETTIEDLVCVNAGYLKHIMYCAFPIIADDEEYKITSFVLPENYPTVQVAVEAFIEKHKRDIASEITESSSKLQKLIDKQTASMQKLADEGKTTTPAYQKFAKELDRSKKSIAQIEIDVQKKWRAAAMHDDSIIAVLDELDTKKDKKTGKVDKVKFPITFAWHATDPYHGLVVFPSKS
jgi:hypothetical protein